jgi:hypothetical protein
MEPLSPHPQDQLGRTLSSARSVALTLTGRLNVGYLPNESSDRIRTRSGERAERSRKSVPQPTTTPDSSHQQQAPSPPTRHTS